MVTTFKISEQAVFLQFSVNKWSFFELKRKLLLLSYKDFVSVLVDFSDSFKFCFIDCNCNFICYKYLAIWIIISVLYLYIVFISHNCNFVTQHSSKYVLLCPKKKVSLRFGIYWGWVNCYFHFWVTSKMMFTLSSPHLVQITLIHESYLVLFVYCCRTGVRITSL